MTSTMIRVGLSALLLLVPLTLKADAVYRYAVQLPCIEEQDSTDDTNIDAAPLPCVPEMHHMEVSIGQGDIAISGYEDADLIYRGDEQQLVAIDHVAKSFVVLDVQTVKSLAITLSAALTRIRAELETLPPDQRELIEQRLKQQFSLADDSEPAVFEIRNVDRRGEAGGIACDWWEVYENESLIREVCSAKPSDLPDGVDSLKAMIGLGRLQVTIFDELATSMPLEMPDNPFAMLEEMGGIPIISNGLNSRDQEGSMALAAADERSLPPEAFKPPADYARQDFDLPAN